MKRFILALFFCAAFVSAASAEEFYCEVMNSEGVVTVDNQSVSGQVLKEGDILKVDDVVQVGSDSYVDLAYDREWNNVTRVEENSKIRIRALYPTTVELQSGGLYAKLKSLPKESTFDVQTPTAIASVRGTEYRTTFLEGETQVYNLSDSNVYVYGLDSSGQRQTRSVIIRNSEKTQVAKRGEAPGTPRRMQAHELQYAERFRQGIENKIKQNIAKGHLGKIQNLKRIEKTDTKSNSLISLEGEGGRQRRSEPKVLSSEEAHQASGRIRRRSEEPGTAPQPKEQRRQDGFGQPFGPDPGRRPKDHRTQFSRPERGDRKSAQVPARTGAKPTKPTSTRANPPPGRNHK